MQAETSVDVGIHKVVEVEKCGNPTVSKPGVNEHELGRIVTADSR